jgi:hypothetical protein
MAEDVWHQPWDGVTGGRNAQQDPVGSDANFYHFDNFIAFSPGATIERVTIYGFEDVGSTNGADVAYHLRITALPSFTNPGPIYYDLMTSPQSTTYRNGDLVFDHNIALNVGEYWISAWVERPFSAGKWFWRGTTPISFNQEHWSHNPGGGLGFGTNPAPGSSIYGAQADLAFRLETNIPEPIPLVAMIIGLLTASVLNRERRQHFIRMK